MKMTKGHFHVLNNHPSQRTCFDFDHKNKKMKMKMEDEDRAITKTRYHLPPWCSHNNITSNITRSGLPFYWSMWRLSSVVKRERNTAKKLVNNQFQLNQHVSRNLQRTLSSAATGSSSPDVAVQLDYYMSLQFAGVACALVNGESFLTMCIHRRWRVLFFVRNEWWTSHKRLQ